TNVYSNSFFWRTWDQMEIDLLEERNGKLYGYEFKWKDKKITKGMKLFLETYPQGSVETITSENYLKFVV
ncbi:MAG: hypothetical protein KAH01_04785, partial [Caldisericia bacterium]|nr:hypothetical protein [Caldisericia bacterium]